MGEPTVKLYHGDCLEILPTLEAGSVDVVVTDPPFGIDFKYKSHKDVFEFVCDSCGMILQLFDGKTIAIWQSMKNVSRIHEWCNADYRIIADINSCPPYRNRSIQYCWEPIVLITPPKKKADIKNKDYIITWKPSWHNAKKKLDHIDHPCVRPLESVRELVRLVSSEGDTILDPFMGSGTTGVACIRTGRSFIGIEIDEGYYNIAKERIERARAEMAQEEMAI